MFDYDSMATGQRKWMLYLLAVLVLGAGFTPFPRIFLGLLLGSVISFYNLWLLQRKVKALGIAVVEKGTAVSLGTLTRIITAVLAIVIALRFEETFHIYSVVIGLASSYVVMIIDSFIRAMREANKS